MLNVSLQILKMVLIVLVAMPVLSSCKVSNEDPTSGATTTSVAHCSKYLKVHKAPASKIDRIEEQNKGDILGSDERTLYIAYSIQYNNDGTKNIQCWLSDGGREYKNDSHAKVGINQNNYCDIVYDLDQPSFGTFTMEYADGWSWINYYDEESGYTFDRKFRNSECVAF